VRAEGNPGRRAGTWSEFHAEFTGRPSFLAAGAHFAAGFAPRSTPVEMLEMGVFSGKHCDDCRPELPDQWFVRARIAARARPRA